MSQFLAIPTAETFQSRFSQLRSKIIQSPAILLNEQPIPHPVVEKEGIEGFKEKLMDIFVKHNRTEEETRFLYAVIKDYSFFNRFRTEDSDIESEAALYICQNLRYQAFPAGSVIFKQGDQSNGKMYLVYSGFLRVEMKQMDPIVMENLKEKQNETKILLQRMGTNRGLEDGEMNFRILEMKKKMSRTSSRINDDDLTRTPKTPTIKLHKLEEASYSKEASQNHSRHTSQSPSEGGSPRHSYHVGSLTQSPFRKSPTLKKTYTFDMDQSLQESKADSKVSSMHDLVEEENHQINLNLHKAESLLKIFEVKKDKLENKSTRTTLAGTLASLKFLRKMKSVRKKNKFTNDIRHVIDHVKQGGFFGEKALISNNPRGATIMAITDCELLSITKEEFEIVKIWFDKKKNRVIQFIQHTFPRLEVSSAQILENFYYLIEEKHYKLGNHVIREGDYGDMFYLIFEGQCEIIKRVSMDETKHFKYPLSEASDLIRSSKRIYEELTLSTLGASSFFGEEIIFKKNPIYDYTVRVSSKGATILCISKYKFQNRFPRSVHRGLKEYYQQKTDLRVEQLKSLLDKKFKVMDVEKNVSNLFGEEIGDFYIEKDNEIDGFSNRPYYSAFKSTNQSNVQFSKDIMEKLHLQDTVSRNKEEFIQKIKHEQTRIRAMREEFLPLARSDHITGPEIKIPNTRNQVKKNKRLEKIKKMKEKEKEKNPPRSYTPKKFKSPRNNKLKIPLPNENQPFEKKIDLSKLRANSPPLPQTFNKTPQKDDSRSRSPLYPELRTQTPQPNELRSKSPLQTDFRTQTPQLKELRSRSPLFPEFRTQTPQLNELRMLSPMTERRLTKADITNNDSFNMLKRANSKPVAPDDLAYLSPKYSNIGTKAHSNENPYNFRTPRNNRHDLKPIRSNEVTNQVQTWSEAYANALNKMAQEPKESLKEREKRINKLENFKLDVGTTIPVIENKYKVIKMKMNFQNAQRDKVKLPRGPLPEYKYDFLDKSLLEKFANDLSSPRDLDMYSPVSTERHMQTSTTTDTQQTQMSSFSPRNNMSNNSLGLITSFEKELSLTKSLKDGQLKTRLRTVHRQRVQLGKLPRTQSVNSINED